MDRKKEKLLIDNAETVAIKSMLKAFSSWIVTFIVIVLKERNVDYFTLGAELFFIIFSSILTTIAVFRVGLFFQLVDRAIERTMRPRNEMPRQRSSSFN